jgi:hypothetical protein
MNFLTFNRLVNIRLFVFPTVLSSERERLNHGSRGAACVRDTPFNCSLNRTKEAARLDFPPFGIGKSPRFLAAMTSPIELRSFIYTSS